MTEEQEQALLNAYETMKHFELLHTQAADRFNSLTKQLGIDEFRIRIEPITKEKKINGQQ